MVLFVNPANIAQYGFAKAVCAVPPLTNKQRAHIDGRVVIPDLAVKMSDNALALQQNNPLPVESPYGSSVSQERQRHVR